MAIQSVHYQGKGYAVTRRMKVGSGGLIAYGSCAIDTSDDTGNTVVQGAASTTNSFVGFGTNTKAAVEGDWIDVLVPVKGVVAKGVVGGTGAIAAGTVVAQIDGGLIDDAAAAAGADVGVALTASTAVGGICTFMMI